MKTLSSDLADFATGFRLESVPVEVRTRAKHLVLDALGIAIACTQWDFARVAMAGLRELAGTGGDIPVIGYGESLPLRDAVLMNALLIHGLDYDDTHPTGVLHATTSVLPAMLGLATRLNGSGQALLAAYILGVEVTARLGTAAKGGFHQVGFHPTGLIGTFGCALAAAHLFGLDAERAVQAQGIALSFASGSLEFLNDGAWTKRLHPGWAGAAGITAAMLAKNGFIGTRAAYEGRFGLYNSHLGSLADQCDLSLATKGLGTIWETSNIAIKPVPACHFVHACADAASQLHHEWDGATVRRIVARVPAGIMKTVCEPIQSKRCPTNIYEAQFSIPYAVAVGLRLGRFTLDALDPAAYQDADTLALASLVECEADPHADFPTYYGGEVVVVLNDGRVLKCSEPINRGAASRPISNADIVTKFHDNAARVVDPVQAGRIVDAVLSLEQRSASDLARLIGISVRRARM